jgi:hypothetical protein
MASYAPSPSLIATCLHCHEPICHRNPRLWCIQCRSGQRQRAQARGLIKSLWTRRLKAWLKTFPNLEPQLYEDQLDHRRR